MKSKMRGVLMSVGWAISHCPLFTYEAQWVYLLAALIAPWVMDGWVYSRFILFFYFAFLSLLPRTLAFIYRKMRKRPASLIDYTKVKPALFAHFCLKDKARPEVMRSVTGMIVFVCLLGGFSLAFLGYGLCIALFIIIFMLWYLWQDNFSD